MKALALAFSCISFLVAAPFAHAQISSFSVKSQTAAGGSANVQIAGLITSQSSPLAISTTPGAAYSAISGSPPSFNIDAGVGGTVLAWGDYPGSQTTTTVSSSPGHIVNCSGRFRVDQPQLNYSSDNSGQIEVSVPGIGGTLEFEVQSGGQYTVTVLASNLDLYGLQGAINVKTTVTGSDGQPIKTVLDQGTGTFYLDPGRYAAVVEGNNQSVDPLGGRSGIVLVSVDAH